MESKNRKEEKQREKNFLVTDFQTSITYKPTANKTDVLFSKSFSWQHRKILRKKKKTKTTTTQREEIENTNNKKRCEKR